MTAKLPLVTDLDDTLIRTDTLHEGLWAMLGRNICSGLLLPFWLRAGRLYLKHKIAPFSLNGVSQYPLNEPVHEYLRHAAAQGRKVYLATASPEPVAEAISQRVGIFSGVFATNLDRNLKGQVKADVLCEFFGEKCFDYIGDDAADVPVWRVARTAVVASASPRVIELARKANPNTTVIKTDSPTIKDYASAFRTHQWVKNLLVFVPMLLAHDYSIGTLASVVLAFCSLCCCASSIYIVNDLFDLTSDRQHPRKQKRPFAAGDIPLRQAPFCFLGTALLALLPCFWLPAAFFYCLLAYFSCTLTYTIFFKRRLFLDVIVLSGLYVLRIVAGATAAGCGLSNWLMAFAGFLFLGLALLKRTGALAMHDCIEKLPGRAYLTKDRSILETMAVCSGFSAIVVVALYIESLQAVQLYSNPTYLWFTCPILVYWYGRIAVLSHRGEVSDDPVDFTVRDWASRISIMLLCIILLLAI